jgi:nucleoside phosphorylase
MTQQQQKQIDALIITALYDELTALLTSSGIERKSWTDERDYQGFPYHVCHLTDAFGEPLAVAAAWAGQMGETAAAERSRALLHYLQPHCLALCGICAGRRGYVFLGDVILANRVFSYDHGKLSSRRRERDRIEEFFHEITTYNIPRSWEYSATYFAHRFEQLHAKEPERPLSLRFQSDWLLRQLLDIDENEDTYSVLEPRRRANCPRWREVLETLGTASLVSIDSGRVQLTPEGRLRASENRIYFPDATPEDPPFRVHVGPIATGKAVRQDSEIFHKIAQYERKVLGLEMEAAAIGYIAEIAGIPSLIAKSVTDFADQDKDDTFRDFSEKIAAIFLLEFLQEYSPRTLPGREPWSMAKSARDHLTKVEKI